MGIGRSEIVTLAIAFLAVSGLLGVYFSARNMEPLDIGIGSISGSMAGKIVRISGVIDKVRKSASNNIYWTVDDGSGITVPLLESKFKNMPVQAGDSVEIVGVVSQYNGEMEVMPKEINVLGGTG